MFKYFSGIAVFLLFLVFLYSCEKTDDTVIDPSYDSPVIVSVYKSADTIYTTSGNPVISLNVTAFVSENNGSPLKSTVCNIFNPLNGSAGSFNLSYQGDSASLKKYAGTVSVSGISCLLVGNYTLQFIAENETGLLSNQINLGFYVKNTANVPPFITGTNMPDSVVRPVSGQFDLTLLLTLNDSDGLCDIKEVYFDAYRPSGYQIPGRIPMFYFNDSTYTFTNPVTPAVPDSLYGYYKYHFFAVDRSNAVSTGVWDSIKFVRP
jgi:hypothetical protein